MAKKIEIDRVRESLTREASNSIPDDVINDAIELARLRGKENDPNFVLKIVGAAYRKGLKT